MKRHVIIPVVRCVLLATAIALLWTISPDVACGFCPLLFMPPLFITTSCSACSVAAHSQYQVTFTGITDTGCGDCNANYNATFTLSSLITTGSPCFWRLSGLSFCSETTPGSNSTTTIDLLISTNNTDTAQVGVVLSPPVNNVQWLYTTAGAAAQIDCALSSFNVPFLVANPTTATGCGFSSGTCTVTAL